jgi:hypothetical protein
MLSLRVVVSEPGYSWQDEQVAARDYKSCWDLSYRQLQKSKLRIKFRLTGGGGALGHGHRVDR